MTLTIGKRTFSATIVAHAQDGAVYELVGARGARYHTMRNVYGGWMFLIHAPGKARGFGIPSGYESVRLADTDGELRIVSY